MTDVDLQQPRLSNFTVYGIRHAPVRSDVQTCSIGGGPTERRCGAPGTCFIVRRSGNSASRTVAMQFDDRLVDVGGEIGRSVCVKREIVHVQLLLDKLYFSGRGA